MRTNDRETTIYFVPNNKLPLPVEILRKMRLFVVYRREIHLDQNDNSQCEFLFCVI